MPSRARQAAGSLTLPQFTQFSIDKLQKTADEGSVVCSRLFNYITAFCLIIQFLKCQPLSLTCLLLSVLFPLSSSDDGRRGLNI